MPTVVHAGMLQASAGRAPARIRGDRSAGHGVHTTHTRSLTRYQALSFSCLRGGATGPGPSRNSGKPCAEHKWAALAPWPCSSMPRHRCSTEQSTSSFRGNPAARGLAASPGCEHGCIIPSALAPPSRNPLQRVPFQSTRHEQLKALPRSRLRAGALLGHFGARGRAAHSMRASQCAAEADREL